VSVIVVEPARYEDERGWFSESFQRDRYAALGIPTEFAQDSLSLSHKHVLRGLHLQEPAQGKLVTCLTGTIYDVAVDVRPGSRTYKQWIAHELSGENGKQLWIPEGYAHGFVVLSDEALFHYKCTTPYAPDGQISIRWDDPELGIDWPVRDPVLSAKDAAAPLLTP
jgi:dTDP-4-dehydrorhamnose 3,5-epimerase